MVIAFLFRLRTLSIIYGLDLDVPPLGLPLLSSSRFIADLYFLNYREVKVPNREEAEQRSLRRVQAMLGVISDSNLSNDINSVELQFGLGSSSTLQDYESFSGVSFATQTLSERAQYGLLSPSQFVATPEEEVMQLLARLKT